MMYLKFTNVKKSVAERVMEISVNGDSMKFMGKSLYVSFGVDEDGSDFDVQKEDAFWSTQIKDSEYKNTKVVEMF